MIKVWFTDEEKKLIMLIIKDVKKDSEKVEILKKYIKRMQHISVAGEEKEFLEEVMNDIRIKIENLSDEEIINELQKIIS